MMKKTSVSEAVSVALLHPLGRLATHADKRDGAVVSDLYPKKSDAAAQLGSNSVFLEWHTDEAFHDVPPSFVCLYGVRGEPLAQTLIAEFNCSELPPEIARVLSEPHFSIRSDGSHAVLGQRKKAAVLDGEGADALVRYDPVFTDFDNAEAELAFAQFEAFTLRKSLSFTIDTGQALIFNNKIGIHARTEFPPRFDGTDRWIIKSQVVPVSTPEEKFHNSNRFWLNPIGA
jgi:L-asparagine oxygenase